MPTPEYSGAHPRNLSNKNFALKKKHICLNVKSRPTPENMSRYASAISCGIVIQLMKSALPDVLAGKSGIFISAIVSITYERNKVIKKEF